MDLINRARVHDRLDQLRQEAAAERLASLARGTRSSARNGISHAVCPGGRVAASRPALERRSPDPCGSPATAGPG
jgi:hypothetical protein